MRLLVHIKFPGGILPYGRIPPGNSIEGGNIKRDTDTNNLDVPEKSAEKSHIDD